MLTAIKTKPGGARRCAAGRSKVQPTEEVLYVSGDSRRGSGDIQAYGKELEKLTRRHDGVTAEQVLEAAEGEDHIFHDWFTWDNGKAARQYRLDQARELIRWVEIEVRYDANHSKPRELKVVTRTRAFQMIEGDGGTRRYQHYNIIKKRDDYREQVQKRWRRELTRIAAEMSVYDHLDKYAAQLKGVIVGLGPAE